MVLELLDSHWSWQFAAHISLQRRSSLMQSVKHLVIASLAQPQTRGVPPPPHRSPLVWQSSHATPPVPQSVSVFPGWQAPARSQQPVGQVWELQGQVPSG
jgi:hypothetical protein